MPRNDIIYLDNSASSFPKPETTLEAMLHFMRTVGANPGRSGHRLSVEAARILLDARLSLAELFHVPDPLQIVFTRNGTEALNLALKGLLRPGDHVITTSMEHNSVMRPLRALESAGCPLTVVGCSPQGELDPDDVLKAVRPDTRLIVLTHASNVLGTLMPVAEIGRIARAHDLLLCVDAAQTAGAVPIDVEAMHIDLLAFTGHKALFGPQGTGGLYIRKGLADILEPLMQGGTGSRSELERQPEFLPDKFESGTPNTVGIAGLLGGVGFVLGQGVDLIRAKEIKLTQLLMDGLRPLPGLRIYGPADPGRKIAVISFTLERLSPSEIAGILDDEFNIMTRPGLHCAPSAHRTAGTFPDGTLRLSLSHLTTGADVMDTLEAMGKLTSQTQ